MTSRTRSVAFKVLLVGLASLVLVFVGSSNTTLAGGDPPPQGFTTVLVTGQANFCDNKAPVVGAKVVIFSKKDQNIKVETTTNQEGKFSVLAILFGPNAKAGLADMGVEFPGFAIGQMTSSVLSTPFSIFIWITACLQQQSCKCEELDVRIKRSTNDIKHNESTIYFMAYTWRHPYDTEGVVILDLWIPLDATIKCQRQSGKCDGSFTLEAEKIENPREAGGGGVKPEVRHESLQFLPFRPNASMEDTARCQGVCDGKHKTQEYAALYMAILQHKNWKDKPKVDIQGTLKIHLSQRCAENEKRRTITLVLNTSLTNRDEYLSISGIDNRESDFDGDGVPNKDDKYPWDPNKSK